MPHPWQPDVTRQAGGRFQIVAIPPKGRPIDITVVRGVPVQLEEYSSSDPFGWAAARLDFPMITGFDAMGSGDLPFLNPDTSIDIWWIPAQDDMSGEVINPLTQRVTDDYFHPGAVKVWEGFMVSPTQRESPEGDGWGWDALGALFQADGYKARPEFPPRPIPHERLILRGFQRWRRPHLRTHPGGLKIEWPDGWTKEFTASQAANPNVYTPMGLKVGDKYTGFSTRQTGGWDNWLTSFVQDLLAVMWVDDESGVTPGNQWTLTCDVGRRPVLRIRDRFAEEDFSFWYGTPGMKLSGMSSDHSQTSHVLFGEGSAFDGSTWRNAVVSNDGSVTDYAPLVADASVYPATRDNPLLDTSRIVRERMVKFAPGISQEQAERISGEMAAQDRDAGWTGSLELSVDPLTMSRWQIRAGMKVRVRGLAGSGEEGILFHIPEVTASPMRGTVTCKLDSKFRDLLAFEEAVVRARDPLTPAKLLQVNRTSIMIEDQLAPWDYKAGSGYIRTASRSFFKDLPRGEGFPWEAQAARKQPANYPSYYVRVKANAARRKDRWTVVPVLMGEKGTIRLIQVAAFNRFGEPKRVPFHLSLYYVDVNANDMPFDDNGPSPFIEGAFQTVTETGAPLPADNYLAPDQSMIIGWGDADQKAGYSPGSMSDGDPVTGRLVDGNSWTWDCTNNPTFDPYSGKKQPRSAYTIYAAFYCQADSEVFFIGRMFRQEPGS